LDLQLTIRTRPIKKAAILSSYTSFVSLRYVQKAANICYKTRLIFHILHRSHSSLYIGFFLSVVWMYLTMNTVSFKMQSLAALGS